MHHRFCSLDSLLFESRFFWQHSLYHYLDFPWREQLPDLCEWLDRLTLQQVIDLKSNPELLAHEISKWIPYATQLQALCELPDLPSSSKETKRGLDVGVPGRKWHQINEFVTAIEPSGSTDWLEWCAGKGYLGRLLASMPNSNVTSLEIQSQLCVDGQQFANEQALNMTFIEADAFSSSSLQYIKKNQHAVALHACGDLHVTLLKKVAEVKAQAVSISPCCYHLIQAEQYQPLSREAIASSLRLDKQDLRLPLQETVTAGQRTVQHRIQEVTYRLGFDSLQREINHSSRYLPVPSIKKSKLAEGFEAFCLWAANKKDLTLPRDTDFSHWLQCGEQRFELVEKMDLVQQVFKRPLELWLVLDRALFMQEKGYDVQLDHFCEREYTPRNILLRAQLPRE